jgi:hypothetical protein
MSLHQRLRGHRLDLALIAIAIVLVGVVSWDRGRVSTGEAELRKHELFDAWRPDKVQTIAYEGGGKRFVLSVQGDATEGRGWAMTVDGEPVPIDDQSADALLVTLEYAAFERRVEGLSPAELGLEPPTGSLRIEMPPLAYQLRIGKEAPGEGAYVEVEGGGRGTVHYVISAETLARLRLDPADFRSRRLAPFLSISVQGFDLAHGETRFSIDRGGWGGRTAGAFLVKTERDAVRADRGIFDAWLTALGELSAQSFVAIPADDPPDAAVITSRPQDPKEPVGKLVIGGDCEEEGQIRVVRRGVDPVAACAPRDVVDRLLIEPASLFDRLVIGTAEGDITEMRFSAGPLVVDVARKEAGWVMRAPTAGAVDDEAMQALLDDLVAATGDRLSRQEASELGDLGLEKPVATLQIRGLPERTGGGEARTEIVEVGARIDDSIHLRRKDDGAVLRLPYESARSFLPRPETLRSLSVLELPLRAIRGLSLACGAPQRMTRAESGAWTLERPDVELGVDLALANDFADKIRNLRALRWVSSEAEAGHGLGEPWCTVTLTVVPSGGDEQRIAFELGAETQGGYFARRAGTPGIFVAPRAMGLSASRWLLDRTALLIDSSRLSTVTLRGSDDRRLEIRVSGGRWVAPSRGLGEQVQSALADLVAEGVVGLGPPSAAHGFDAPRLRIELAGDGGPVVLEIGSGEVWRDTNVFFVRRSDVDATFAVAQARVRPLLDAL